MYVLSIAFPESLLQSASRCHRKSLSPRFSADASRHSERPATLASYRSPGLSLPRSVASPYYETQGGFPRAHVIVALAKRCVSQPTSSSACLEGRRLEVRSEKAQTLEEISADGRLPERDQRALIPLINSLVSVSDQQRGKTLSLIH